jgi:hypothetical protein
MKNLKNIKIYKNRYDVPNDNIVLVDANEVEKEIEKLNQKISRLKNPALRTPPNSKTTSRTNKY